MTKPTIQQLYDEAMAKIEECQQTLDWVPRQPITLSFIRGRRAGEARLGKYQIAVNQELIRTHTDEIINVTVPHEVAHIYAYEQHKDSGHQLPWRQAMARLGLPAKTTHSMPAKPAFKQRRYEYACTCRTHMLSATKHNRIRRRTTTYRCTNCGNNVFPTGE